MTTPDATVTETAGVLTVSFVREAKLNAISDEMTATLWDAAYAIATREDLRALVISATGPYFSAGMDIGGTLAMNPVGVGRSSVQFRHEYRRHHALYDELESIEKPIIASIQGHCLGGGLELATACDFRFAATEATFGLPEVRLGVIAGGGGCTRLTRLIGPHWTKWLAMAGQRIDAQTALRIGLVHDVVPRAELEGRVTAFAQELVELPAEAVGATKMVVDASVDADRTNQRVLERLANTTLAGSEDSVRRRARFRPQQP